MASPSQITQPRTSPIFSIQPEILSHIFLLAKEDEEWENGFDWIDFGEFQPTISQEIFSRVSAHFRGVALGIPFLWSSINVCPTTSPHQVKTYCDRSSSVPLAIRIEVNCPWPTNVQPAADLLHTLRLIVSQSHRWRAVTVLLSRQSHLLNPLILDLFSSGPAPLLKYMTISVDSVPVMVSRICPTSNKPTMFQNDAQGIKFLRLRGLAVPFFWPHIGGLTSLHLDHTMPLQLSYETFNVLVSTSQNISYLSLYVDTLSDGTDWPTTSTPQDSIQLPSLTSLRIRGNDGTCFDAILRNIYTPLLRSLLLKDMLDGDLHYDERRYYADRIPRLTELTLHECTLSGPAFRALTKIFPLLRSLTTISTVIEGTVKLLKCLWSCTTQDIYPSHAHLATAWPRLRVLGLALPDERDSSLYILRFLKHRIRMKIPVTTLRFTTWEDESEVHAWLGSDSGAVGFTEEYGVTSITTTGFDFGPSYVEDAAHWDCDDTMF